MVTMEKDLCKEVPGVARACNIILCAFFSIVDIIELKVDKNSYNFLSFLVLNINYAISLP